MMLRQITNKKIPSPDQEARRAVQDAALHYLLEARALENAVLEGSAPEALHKFRVALRKSRSTLSVGARLFPAATLRAWKLALGGVCKHTNRLRDLDVHREALADLKKSLPPTLRPGLADFLKHVAAARTSEARAVAAFFTAKDYRIRMERVAKALATPRARTPVRPDAAHDVAADFIARRYKRISESVRQLGKHSADAEIHAIRIDCKKLRYALDIFGGTLPEKSVKALTKALARLQKRLGQFNDSSVLQRFLLDDCWQQAAASDQRLAMCLGGLVTHLQHCHSAMRGSVLKSLRAFRSDSAKFRIDRLSQRPAT
ncbi:MAG: CHAD domain-containing protein, partial [Deltaproteobacteria bacterium]